MSVNQYEKRGVQLGVQIQILKNGISRGNGTSSDNDK